jgi:outer membrane protein OmpU
MKKIIAAAVAGAFVAPVMAADVTVSGKVEMSHIDRTSTYTTADLFDTTTVAGDTSFTIAATEEIGNGITISADLSLTGDGSDDGGDSITLSGPFGKLDMGDTSGAVDSVDDSGDVFKVFDNGIGGSALKSSTSNSSALNTYISANSYAENGVSKDAAVQYTLPTFVEGLTVITTYTPQDGHAGNISGASADGSGLALKFATPFGATIAYAKEDIGTTENTLIGIKGSFNGVGYAYETAENDVNGTKEDYKSMMVNYSMGDITVAMGNTTIDDGGTETSDQTTYGVHYAMGGATFFVETMSDDKRANKPDATAFGVEFAF